MRFVWMRVGLGLGNPCRGTLNAHSNPEITMRNMSPGGPGGLVHGHTAPDAFPCLRHVCPSDISYSNHARYKWRPRPLWRDQQKKEREERKNETHADRFSINKEAKLWRKQTVRASRPVSHPRACFALWQKGVINKLNYWERRGRRGGECVFAVTRQDKGRVFLWAPSCIYSAGRG